MNFSELTTLNIGGQIKQVIPVHSENELIESFKQVGQQSYIVIGGGSNLLVSDRGFNGIIIKNEITGIEKSGNKQSLRDKSLNLIVKSGTVLQDLVDFANENGLAGLEALAGIPGTVGGAIFGNAGAYGQTISDHLTSVKALRYISIASSKHPELGSFTTGDIEKKEFGKADCQFNYRNSVFKRNGFIILEAAFSLTPADSVTLKKTSAETVKKREVKYPPGIRCPGSFFKNIPQNTLPEEILDKLPKEFVLFGKVSAGALLESVGAKGAKEGNILIAPYHANLFINLGGGTAEDFYELAKTYSQKVFDRYGIRLEPEVQLINLPQLL